MELYDLIEAVERVGREWDTYGDKKAEEEGREGRCAGESGGCGCASTCEPNAKGPEMLGRAGVVPASREVAVGGDLRVRLMSRFRPFVCPCPCASSFSFNLGFSLSNLPLPRTLVGVGVLHRSRIRTPRRYISMLPSGSSRFVLTLDSEESMSISVSVSISISILSTSTPISVSTAVQCPDKGDFASSSSMTSAQYPAPSW
jgi:hypothetical protein